MTCMKILEKFTASVIIPVFLFVIQIVSSDELCENLPLLNNGELLLDDRMPPFRINESIRYKCNEDFMSDQRDPQITCVLEGKNANWTDTERACKPIVRSCHDPGFIENADRIGNLFTFPNNITYICKEGYKMMGQGSGTKVCSKTGNWMPDRMPYCEAILCPALSDPQNGKVLMSNRRLNSIATYSCASKFKLFGSPTRVCQINGSWNGTNPVCKEITCPHPGELKNGRVIGKNGTFFASDIVIYQCNDGSDHVTSKCTEHGEWSVRAPVCPEIELTTELIEEGNNEDVTSCEDPGKIKNGDRTILGLHVNSTATYFCDEGYQLRGKSTLLCMESGKWDLDKLPICVKPLGVPAIIGIVLGVIIFISLVVGGYLWYKYRVKSLRGYGKKSKALTADATDIEEIAGLDRDRKQIPVTVL